MNQKVNEQIKKLIEEAGPDLHDGNLGFCIGCGVEVDGVEPDARKYQCDSCDQRLVYGLEELVIMGYGV